jgi:hypothetical protein
VVRFANRGGDAFVDGGRSRGLRRGRRFDFQSESFATLRKLQRN